MSEQEKEDTKTARETLENENVEVNWKHPRHGLERPVLVVWPNPLREEWAAEVLDNNRAKVVVREVMIEVESDGDEDTTIEKHSESVDLCFDTIPQYVEQALLNYEGEYGPVDEVINNIDEDTTEIPEDPSITLDEYFD